MAIAPPASSQAGPQPKPHEEPSQPDVEHTETGIELEAALPVAEPPVESDTTPRVKKKKSAAPETSALVIAGVDESSASHLTGSSARAIHAVDAKFHRLLETVHENRPADDLEIIRGAWSFCLLQHEGQKRASGEPYIIHPLEVAQVLAELKMDSTAIAAGLLHDAVEDTNVTSAEIAKRFGDQVAHIVEGVTKLEKIKFANREDHQAENIRKMLLAMVTDVRVVIIKLADRLHNMRTLEHLKPEKQQKIARETLDIYAPLAHRLGMGKLRGELEDLAFRYTDPYAYEQVSTEVDALRGAGEEFLQKIVKQLEAKLKEVEIQGRVE
jgi:guanosine-3',5'-bis(diphosphate) 3'-pyrophosphohydrolase